MSIKVSAVKSGAFELTEDSPIKKTHRSQVEQTEGESSNREDNAEEIPELKNVKFVVTLEI